MNNNLTNKIDNKLLNYYYLNKKFFLCFIKKLILHQYKSINKINNNNFNKNPKINKKIKIPKNR